MQIVSLSGGLGNQLFQIAAALKAFPEGDIYLEYGIGFASTNNNKEPEVWELPISSRFKLINYKEVSPWIIRAVHQVMRIESTQKKIPVSIIFVLRKFAEFAIYARYKKYFRIRLDPNEAYGTKGKNRILIGYFHTSVHLLSLKNRDEVFCFNTNSFEKYPDLNNQLLNDNITMIHIRLGDYEKEHSLGILPASYFEAAIKKVMFEDPETKLWIFSNDVNRAKQELKVPHGAIVKWLDSEHFNTLDSFRLMMMCNNKILANSTFSWWAAIMSKKTGNVYYPRPWFINAHINSDLFVSNWEAIESWKPNWFKEGVNNEA